MSGSKSTSARSGGSAAADTIRRALGLLQNTLRPLHGSAAGVQAEHALSQFLGTSREQLHLDPPSLDNDRMHGVERMCGRLAAGEPLAYVLGAAYFHCVKLVLDRSTLIPRPDTEVLVETVLARQPPTPAIFADMGTGSGAVAAALLHQRHAWRCVATDTAGGALALARRNTDSSRCLCARMDCLEALAGSLDFIVSNPPYIPSAHIDTLERSVREFEPRAALDGGEDGLVFYRRLAHEAGRRLGTDGALYVEIGYDQGGQVTGLLGAAGWRSVEVHHDLASRPRVVSARRPHA
jgi:release factor glutamine methyltransferase